MKTIIVTAGVIGHKGRVLIAQRRENDSHGLKWEFPGGKLNDDEAPRECLEREILEETSLRVKAGDVLDSVFYKYKEKNVLILIYSCKLVSGKAKPIECRDLKWVYPKDFDKFDFLEADREFILKLLKQ